MTKNLIISPRISQHTPQPIVGSIDKNISFYCQGVNYNNKEIKIIILDGKNARDDVVGHYLVKKCLLDFDIYDEIEETAEDTLSFSNYGLKGFFKGSLSFKVLKVKDKYGADNKVKIQVADNLFNSNSKTILLPESNKQVKEVILSKKKSQEINDKETGADFLKTDWSEVEGETFTIKNVDGSKCYFEGDDLILNEFGEIVENKNDEDINIQEKSVEEFEKKSKEYQELLKKYEEEVRKNKQLLTEKDLLIQQKKKSSETSYWDKVNLEQQLKAANERIKKLEAEKVKFEKQLQDLHDFAKNNSTSRSSTSKNPSNLKTQLSQLQIEQDELKKKLEEEKKKNEDLTQQIDQLTKTNSASPLWGKIKKPVIIGLAVVGGILLVLFIYKYWRKIF